MKTLLLLIVVVVLVGCHISVQHQISLSKKPPEPAATNAPPVTNKVIYLQRGPE